MTKTLMPFLVGAVVVCRTRLGKELNGIVEETGPETCLIYFGREKNPVSHEDTYFNLGPTSDVSVNGNVITFH